MEKVPLNPEFVFYPLKNLISTSHSSVLFGLRTAEKIKENLEPTVEEMQLLQLGSTHEKDIDTTKNEFKNWILIKGFEEIHNAVRHSLERFLVFISIYDQFKDCTLTCIEYEEFEKKISLKIKKLDHPRLLKQIENKIGERFLFEKHIQTINNARNCLVHDFGMVKKHRCNDDENQKLIIKGKKIHIFLHDSTGQKIPFEFPTLIKTPFDTSMEYEDVILEFRIGERLNLTYEDYIQVLYACWLYEYDLRDKLNKYCA